MKNLIDTIKKYSRKINKYGVAVAIFAVITFIIGDSTLQKRISYDREIRRLKGEIEHYTNQREDNQQKLDALRSDNESLEKLAREQYRMIKPNEDLFIVTE
jgi:cell division protein FtsB